MILRVQIPGNPWRGRINVRTGMRWSKARREAKAYQEEVALRTRQAIIQHRWLRLDQPAHCWIRLLMPDRRRRDLDGPIKAIFDGLTDGGAWADDWLCKRLIVDMEQGEPCAIVQIRPVPPMGG